MNVIRLLAIVLVPFVLVSGRSLAQYDDVAAELNSMGNKSTEANKSYRTLFDAYLDMTTPPMNVGPNFNLSTIHNKMKDWDKVKAWAEANASMGKAIMACKTNEILGLPYGVKDLDPRYRNAGLGVELGVGGNLREIKYGYLAAMDKILAYTVAEMYRLLEAKQGKPAWDLGVSMVWVVRQCCDRELLAEKMYSMRNLSALLTAMREMMYANQDTVSADDLTRVAVNELPFLWPNDRRLAMPEGDQIIARRLLKEAFNDRGQPDMQRFVETFAVRQAESEPYTIFGAARRWAHISQIHGSLMASNQRITVIYDDWWRRWRMRHGDPMLLKHTQFDLTNPIRYGAVLFSLQDIEQLFDERPLLVDNINGTALSAGLLAMKIKSGRYPPAVENTHGQTSRQRSNADWFDDDYGIFEYSTASKQPMDTPYGRIEVSGAVLWSKGQNGVDDRARQHTPDGLRGDLVLWPPPTAVAREQGLTQ